MSIKFLVLGFGGGGGSADFIFMGARIFLIWGEVHPKTAPLQALHCALCSTEQSTFKGEKGAKRCREKAGKRGGWQKGQKSENSRRLWLSEIPCWKGFPANFDAAGK